MAPISDLQVLLRSMEPVLNAGEYVFASLDASTGIDLRHCVAFVREPEGHSVVLEVAEARRQGIPAEDLFAWITLSVHSGLQAVGLTAAFSDALGNAGISCNVVAGTHHDHIFVPVAQAAKAMAELQALQNSANNVAGGPY